MHSAAGATTTHRSAESAHAASRAPHPCARRPLPAQHRARSPQRQALQAGGQGAQAAGGAEAVLRPPQRHRSELYNCPAHCHQMKYDLMSSHGSECRHP